MQKITFIILFFFSGISLIAQTTKVVNVSSQGNLKNLITTSEQTTVSTLTLTGSIDARDFAFMRDKLSVLAVLDLSMVSIKAYTGADGTNTGVYTAYIANEIPVYAFYDPLLFTYKATLTTIKFPSTTSKIGEKAFYYCYNLSSTIIIPASLTKIGDAAFYGCSSISTFSVVPSNPRYSSSSGVLFNKSQDSLFIFPPAKGSSYTIPSTVKHVGSSAFDNCLKVSLVTIPTSVTSIGSYAFSGCSGVVGSLTLPTSLKTMGDGAFYGCSGLSGTVTIPASLTDFGNYCFLESNNISSFVVNTSNPNYSSENGILYSKNKDTLFICPPAKQGAVSIPSTVKLLGSYAFYNCSKLTGTVNIPASVDYIGYYAFYGCSSLNVFEVNPQNNYFSAENGVLFSKNKDRLIAYPILKNGTYSMPTTVMQIDPAAFAFSQLSGALVLPASVNAIGDYAFYNAKQISAINVDGANQRYSSDNGVLLNRTQDTLFMCPFAKTGSFVVPATVKHINYSAFDGCAAISAITLPNSLISIGGYAFEYCTGLTKILLPLHTTNISDGAFYSCSSLTELSIANPNPPIVDYYTFDQINKSLCKLIVPVGSSTIYSATNYWKDFTMLSEQLFYSAISENSESKISYSLNGNVLTLKNAGANQNLMIYSIAGVLVYNAKPESSIIQISLPAKGFYIVWSENNVFKISF
ncbi:MAG: hypothetical protein AUK44_05975 [Porphyromonadaceae bacterium CG2_30_38_12]|nr:MAG: hypothetical protein AUK44_05975 [Porphyromonadaceae bacterium CG2_30_38_12]